MWRYFTRFNTKRYVDVLDQLVGSYNRSVHTGTCMRPIDVDDDTERQAHANLKDKYEDRRKTNVKFKVGDLVRINRARGSFAKGYERGWTTEIFRVARVSKARPPVGYVLQDLSGEPIRGLFYTEELGRVRKNLDEEYFEIDEILEERGVRRKERGEKIFGQLARIPGPVQFVGRRALDKRYITRK